VTPQCGFLVSLATQERVVAEIAEDLLALAKDPDMRSLMGAEGRRRVASAFSWELKSRWMMALYEECIQ
jgi:glycosyltransferase involved in cell wall biosynthesis